MKKVDSWWFPDGERHLPEWMANAKNRIILNGRPSYQGKKQIACINTVKKYKGTARTAIDVGGHIGLWSFNLAAAFQHVLAFEPVAAHRECFARNVEARNVELIPCALGKEEGSVSIYTAPTSSGDSYVNGGGEIPLKTLDTFTLAHVDFIKIDCEGYEENVLRGAEHLLKTWKPVVCVEQKRDMASTRFGLAPLGAVKFLQTLGYGVEQEIGGDYIMVAK